MPTYDYKCDACGEEFEHFQSITSKTLRKCPSCGKLKLRRLIGTGAGVIFKGSGFYETDYRTDSYKKAAKKDADAASGVKPDSGTGDKTKPEAKKTDAGASDKGSSSSGKKSSGESAGAAKSGDKKG